MNKTIMMDQFSSLVAILLAISLATERLVTIVKTIWPNSLGEESLDSNGIVDQKKDRGRKLIIQFLSFLFAWLTSSFLTGAESLDLFGWIKVGGGDDPLKVHVVAVALLSMGGSAFWNNILGYTKAVKDIKVNEKSEKETGMSALSYSWKHKRMDQDPTAVLKKFDEQGAPNLKQPLKSRL
jgi:hypothetical protein